ncbi:hypothetical protein CKM354_000777900 [Cercospora kikuchii]|uniref:Heterokaryon incompatibility domain-containing protein n=1 Tax=Cercospora kikuchii TaxID=84275 RepID=A0A9P3CQ49_9PEZI|nr:uncharacterized protein CKM354_000777900 [Cercospora kikuchii]GIZ44585.1 hypothetical protein CKM354_000777900 [Cercospora kikuchii]
MTLTMLALVRQHAWSITSAPRSTKATEDGTAQRLHYAKLPTRDQHIRLLVLWPCSANTDPIKCSLAVERSDTSAEYEALSYAWGKASDARTVWIGAKSYNVTQNLFMALQELRGRDGRPRILWVDAVCINQRDNEERATQVQMMTAIYQNAKRVIVWVGPESKTTPYLRITYQFWKQESVDDAGKLAEGSVFDHAKMHPQANEAVQSMLSREWFGRAWVMQEAILARDAVIRCGAFQEDWKTFCAFLCDYRRYYRNDSRGLVRRTMPQGDNDQNRMNEAISKEFETLRWINLPFSVAVINAAREAGHEMPLLDLLGYARLQRASDPRDKIYAIMGLLSGKQRALVPPPDYDAEIVEVYTAFATCAILSTGTLDVLSWKNPYVESFFTEMPSWVPDWRSLYEAGNVGSDRVQAPVMTPRHGAEPYGNHNQVHNAALYLHSPYNFEFTDERIFHARGIRVDVIPDRDQQLEGLHNDNLRYDQNFEFRREQIVESHVRDLKKILVDSGTMESDTFWRILSHDQYTKNLSTDIGAKPVDLDRKDTWYQNDRIDLKGAQDLILRTKAGYWGSFPRNTKPGLLIVVLFGARKPVLLREHNGLHVFVGECYIHGIMDGEIVREQEAGKRETEVFHIV